MKMHQPMMTKTSVTAVKLATTKLTVFTVMTMMSIVHGAMKITIAKFRSTDHSSSSQPFLMQFSSSQKVPELSEKRWLWDVKKRYW